MPLYRMLEDALGPVRQSTLAERGVKERADRQRLLRDRIEILLPDAFVLAEEFGDWEDARRRIDLLCLDKNASLIVVELKRGSTGSHMELQALRYAAMVSTMTFDQAVEAHSHYLARLGREGNARERLLKFLGRESADESEFGQEVRIVLVSEDFGKELTTAVLWLNRRDLDITCVRLLSYDLDGSHLVQLERIIPLPEAAEYQSKLREKEQESRRAQAQNCEAPAELLEAVAAYDPIAREGFETTGRAWNYRQIRPPDWSDPIGTHYEFLYASGKHLGVELHIERARARLVADVLRPLAGRMLGEAPEPLQWDPSWSGGKGRLTCRLPLNTPPEVAAKAMHALIALTHDVVTQRLNGLASGGDEDE